MANKDNRRGNREKKKPKQVKKEAPANVSIFATPLGSGRGRKSK
jgi:hypothetical protein